MNRRTSLNLCALLASGLLACGTHGPADVDQLQLPGDSYYPESFHIAADGTLFVGSLATGQVVKFAPGQTVSTPFVAQGVLKGVAGVLVDDARSLVYVCAVDPLTMVSPAPAAVRSFNLSDGSPKATYTFPAPAFCNDMALDGKHNLYVADSYGKVYRLQDGGTALAQWSADPKLASAAPMGFGADGIAWDGASNLFVNTFTDGALLRIPINADGSAGAAVAITVTPALAFPDGMRMLDGSTLLLAEGVGRISKVALNGTSGTATPLQTGLNGPVSVVKYESHYWVCEGQLGHLFGQLPGPPTTPFLLRRFPAN